MCNVFLLSQIFLSPPHKKKCLGFILCPLRVLLFPLKGLIGKRKKKLNFSKNIDTCCLSVDIYWQFWPQGIIRDMSEDFSFSIQKILSRYFFFFVYFFFLSLAFFLKMLFSKFSQMFSFSGFINSLHILQPGALLHANLQRLQNFQITD